MYVNIFEILSEMGIFLEKIKIKENERPTITFTEKIQQYFKFFPEKKKGASPFSSTKHSKKYITLSESKVQCQIHFDFSITLISNLIRTQRETLWAIHTNEHGCKNLNYWQTKANN